VAYRKGTVAVLVRMPAELRDRLNRLAERLSAELPVRASAQELARRAIAEKVAEWERRLGSGAGSEGEGRNTE
jgi:predicted DNA-binding protein